MAIAALKRIPTDHPQYAEAQALIAQWEAPAEPEEPAGPSREDLARRDALVRLAQEARQGQEYLRASNLYERAAQLAALDEEDRLLQAEVQQRLAGLEGEVELFRRGDWEFALPELWRLHAANPDDRDVVRLMVDSYFTLGVRDLQRGDTAEAAEKLTRARELDPDDDEVARLLRFAEVYGSRPSDLLYRIFVKYLRFR
jgi:tetratricopeptide (TPR) repeat protein